MTKLIIVFRNFVNAPENKYDMNINKCTIFFIIGLVFGILQKFSANLCGHLQEGMIKNTTTCQNHSTIDQFD